MKDVNVHVLFDGRFTPFALAGAARKGNDGVVVLGRRHWPFLPASLRWRTIIHEACHLVDMWRDGMPDDPHGPRWVALMQQCGADPGATLSQDHLWTIERVRACFPRRKWVVRCCACTYAYGMTTAMAAEYDKYIDKGKCPVCEEIMVLEPIPAAAVVQ